MTFECMYTEYIEAPLLAFEGAISAANCVNITGLYLPTTTTNVWWNNAVHSYHLTVLQLTSASSPKGAIHHPTIPPHPLNSTWLHPTQSTPPHPLYPTLITLLQSRPLYTTLITLLQSHPLYPTMTTWLQSCSLYPTLII